MRFILTGFTQDSGFRVFAFEGLVTGQLNMAFTVRADLALSRKYGIRLQDLPLICREVLEHREEGEEQRAWTYTEDAMRIRAVNLAEARDAAALNKKSSRKPGSNGAAWGSTWSSQGNR